MNVNFEYYKIFYYVARYHNFTKAAKVLGNSQPNVTRAMNCLEQQLGRILFVRTNRGVQLTRDGEQLYSYVEAAMSQLLTAEDELADGENLTHGSITIGVSETALNIYLLDRLRAFHMAYPGINLKIYNHSTPQAVDEVKNGSIDFAVVTTPADVEAPLKKIVLQSYREILIGGTTFSSLKKQKLSNCGDEELSYDLSRQGDYDIQILRQNIQGAWRGACAGHGGGHHGSDTATCEV